MANEKNYFKAHYVTPSGNHIEYWFKLGQSWANLYEALMKEKGRKPTPVKDGTFNAMHFDELNIPEDRGEHQDLSDIIECSEDADLYFIGHVGREKTEAYEVVDRIHKPTIGTSPLTREATINMLKRLNTPKDEMALLSYNPEFVQISRKTEDPNASKVLEDIINGTNLKD